MAAREGLGATGGFPPPAAELEALGLVTVPFFTIVDGGGGGEVAVVEDLGRKGERQRKKMGSARRRRQSCRPFSIINKPNLRE